METSTNPILTVSATVNAAVEKVWTLWTGPEHIMKWNHASDDWHTPYAENDLRVGGKFVSRMAAKDGCMSFDFNGIYEQVKMHEALNYSIEGGRKVSITFESKGNTTLVTESFETETENSLELQRTGWQAILDSFKKYVEAYPG